RTLRTGTHRLRDARRRLQRNTLRPAALLAAADETERPHRQQRQDHRTRFRRQNLRAIEAEGIAAAGKTKIDIGPHELPWSASNRRDWACVVDAVRPGR